MPLVSITLDEIFFAQSLWITGANFNAVVFHIGQTPMVNRRFLWIIPYAYNS